jgi:hypothetical protein
MKIRGWYEPGSLTLQRGFVESNLWSFQSQGSSLISSWFPYQMMFVLSNSNMTDVTCGAGTADLSGAPTFTSSFSGVSATQSLVSCVVFCRSLLVLLSFFFDHCIVCPSLIGGFWLPLWYLQTFFLIWKPSWIYNQ